MKLLIIGNRKHQLLYGLIDDLKKEDLNNSFKIDILTQESTKTTHEFDYNYRNIFYLKVSNFFLNNRLLRGVLKQLKFRFFF